MAGGIISFRFGIADWLTACAKPAGVAHWGCFAVLQASHCHHPNRRVNGAVSIGNPGFHEN